VPAPGGRAEQLRTVGALVSTGLDAAGRSYRLTGTKLVASRAYHQSDPSIHPALGGSEAKVVPSPNGKWVAIQQKLDVYANEMLLHALKVRESVAIMASEENEHPILAHGGSPNAKYIIVFDPLDGSSNIDVNVSVGTTFSILRRVRPLDEPVSGSEVLQPGHQQLAAGYVLYGSSTMLVYSAGSGVHGFTLDPAVGAYVLSHPDIRIPESGPYYSMNEAHLDRAPAEYRKYVAGLRSGEFGHRYASRYIGSMVSDFHRTLLKGGVFLYPANEDRPEGKLRLLYEANPIAYLAEHAGGQASDGRQRILDVQPHSIHQRTPLIVGGPAEMQAFERVMSGK